MTRCLSITVDGGHAGMRLDAFLAASQCYASRNSAVRHIEAGQVFVNGAAATKKTPLAAGDTIVYELPASQESEAVTGENIPLDVRFEDEWLMVISKQTGLCVHPSPGHYGSTLVNALVYHYGADNLAHIQGDDRPGIVHRLDMETSGLMMCAKDDEVGLDLQDQIQLKQVERRYLALVHGNIAHGTGLIDQPLARGFHERLRMCVTDRPGSRSAVTTFEVLERFEAAGKDQGYTLLECKLFTGRTHQIRVHMEYIGHCCVGDPLYSQGPASAQCGLQRQFLHSYLIDFTHPRTGEKVHLVDGLPPDLQEVYNALQRRSLGLTERGSKVFAMLETAPCQAPEIQLA